MQMGEAMALFDPDQKDKCPMEPHSEDDGFTGKPPKEKNVAELRKSMENGWTTRQWERQGEKFNKKDKQEGPKKESPLIGDSPIEIAEVSYPLSIAAHHIIPGKASLPKAEIKKYIWAKYGFIKSDIGYNCDGSENGLWMPTHQIMSAAMGKKQKIKIHDDENPKKSTKGMSWAKLSKRAKASEGNASTYTQLFLPRYTQQAMIAIGTHFHDTHSDYNDRVLKALTTLSVLINRKMAFCEKCKGKSKGEKHPPPYMLVYRLNALSDSIANRFLKGSPNRKWLKVYTSEFSCRYARTPLPDDKLGN